MGRGRSAQDAARGAVKEETEEEEAATAEAEEEEPDGES